MDALRKFIVLLPGRLDYQHPEAVRQNLYKALYYAASSNGRHLLVLFPWILPEQEAELEDYSFPIATVIEKRPFFNYKLKAAYSHPPNKACARPLKKDEPVYRCEECGYDDTCVLCVHCFNSQDHRDHNVSMYILKGDNGGICDCGDPEAFVNPLNCACQETEVESDALDPDLDSALRATIAVCLNYILDVANFAVHSLPLVHQNINGRGDLSFTSKQISDFLSLPYEVYETIDSNSDDLWHLVLWNDENHDYEEAQAGIRAVTNCSDAKAKEVAHDINSTGRAILKTAKSYLELLKAQNAAEADGLVATILSARDYLRETICQYMFGWLNDVVEFAGYSDFRARAKVHLGDLLLMPGFEFAKLVPSEFFRDSQLDLKRLCFENGMLFDGNFVNGGACAISPHVKGVEALTEPIKHVLTSSDANTNIAKSRLQYLLSFEIRFTSQVRKMLPTLLVPPVVLDADKKAIFCDQFIAIYPQLITVMALSDREELLNSLNDITTQLFTCPRSVLSILRSNKVGNVLGPVAKLIEEHSTAMSLANDYRSFVEIVTDRRSKREKNSIKKAIERGIRDISYLVDKNGETNKLLTFLAPENLAMLLMFLRSFQGYWPIVRKYGEHVEREILDFIVHLEYSVPILGIVKFIASSCKESDIGVTQEAIKIIMDFLQLRKVLKKIPGVAQFRVSKDPVALVNPINSLLSYLIQFQGFEVVSPVLLGDKRPFMNISDFSLRSIVLGCQIKIGFWIRNGMSVSRQASLYIDSIMKDVAYFRDVHLNQIAAIKDDPQQTLFNFLDRWELLAWYQNEVAHDKTIYEHRFSSISEKFIVFIYNLITDRFTFTTSTTEERLHNKAIAAICYSLCDEPKSYTTIKNEISMEVAELPDFDILLKECADYQAPTGLMDTGMYRLKKSLFDKLDPLSLHLDSSQFQSVSESLIKNLAKERKIPENEVILIPEIYPCEVDVVKQNLGAFTKTKEFAKLMYKFLQVAIDTSDETYLPQLLHLIHAVLKDDEILHGDNYLNESFVDIPISDLLLAIFESPMSKNVVHKADFLVDQFIAKDRRVMEGLTDCFGEEYMQSYKKRKDGLFESGAEKKKRLAEERKAKVMKKFAKQREKFLEQNAEYEIQEEKHDEESEGESELRVCVSCGEPENTDEAFGFLATVTKGSIFWKLQENDPLLVQHAFADWDHVIEPEGQKVFPAGYKYPKLEHEDRRKPEEGHIVSTCGHGMHHLCYTNATNQMRHFPCPLCHNLHDIFILSLLQPDEKDQQYTRHYLSGRPKNVRYNSIVNSGCDIKCAELSKNMIHEDYDQSLFTNQKISEIASDFMPMLGKETYIEPNASSADLYYGTLVNLTVLIANTIRLTEITIRLGETKTMMSLVRDVPTSTKALIIGLIQCRAALYEHRKLRPLLGEAGGNFNSQIKKLWDSSARGLGDVFTEAIQLFFQTEESWRTITTLTYTKLVCTCIYTLVHRRRNSPLYLENLFKDKPDDGKFNVDDLQAFCCGFISEEEFGKDAKSKAAFAKYLYYATERCILPFLRQMAIFAEFIDPLQSLENSQAVLEEVEVVLADRVDVLCGHLNIPPLEALISDIVRSTEASHFESKIADIMINAKLPTQMTGSHKVHLEYPGTIRLIQLPVDYNACITERDHQSKTNFDFMVCLHCGDKIKMEKHLQHMGRCCKYTAVFFSPWINALTIVIHLGGPFMVTVPAPYLTEHGELKRPKTSGRATLNQFRYNYLTKLWLNQGLHGFVTRGLFGTRLTATGGINDFNFQEEEDDDDEMFGNEDEFFFAEDPNDWRSEWEG